MVQRQTVDGFSGERNIGNFTFHDIRVNYTHVKMTIMLNNNKDRSGQNNVKMLSESSSNNKKNSNKSCQDNHFLEVIRMLVNTLMIIINTPL